MADDQLKAALRKWTLVLGLLQMLVACLWGCLVGAAPDAIKHYRTFTGAHHLFAHQSELLIGVAVAFPHISLPPALLKLTFVLMQVGAMRQRLRSLRDCAPGGISFCAPPSAPAGTWTNPLAYTVIALTDSPQPILPFASPGEPDFYTSLSVGMLMLCAATIIPGLTLLTVGAIADSHSPAGAKKAQGKPKLQ
jgi:hypothetical protein